MQINALFAKRIDRSIEGVVKADDVANLGVEVEEYVLTRDAAKGLEPLLEEYTHYTNANGVWISGFFGSGKSHLLKMLAHILGDVPEQDYSRQAVVGSFQSKTEDETLRALIRRSATIPATSILFNIDQKAALNSKDDHQALLRVFIKVFNEARGYYGGDPVIARFEHDLDSRGEYQAFQDSFARHANCPWSQGREQAALEARNIDRAYSDVRGEETTGILAQYRSYAPSPEDFAREVRAWLADKPEGYRLNFFVDEVGQFIADDVRLMLSLQTIAESLNTVCRGQAWIFVTSQEDMDKVIGDRDKRQSNDFSKIQARFPTRVKLTSQDVEEVISKRLLTKTEAATAELGHLYTAQEGNFSTLFSFTDGAATYQNYKDEARFIATYPFVTYQIPLFQRAREGLSEHNMFEGRNSSVGERSLLGVVQQVATRIRHEELGYLAPFDLMFDGMQGELKSAAQSAVLQAERHLPDPGSAVTIMANRLLKALLLVKYVESFKATPRNLAVLVYDHFDQDLPALNSLVVRALDLLERQSYVQRNGNVYEYLTNEEQEIEKEIKNVDLDSSEFSHRLARHLASDVLRTTKIRYAANTQDFPFGLKLDDAPQGKQHDLTIHVLTADFPATDEEILAQSTGRDELRVVLPKDMRLLRDLRLVLMTEKYLKRRTSAGVAPATKVILQAKQVMNCEREKEVVARLREAVGHARLIINGSEIPSGSSDPVARVNDGFQQLISRVYRNLQDVVDLHLGEADVPRLLAHEPALINRQLDRDALAPAGEEIASFLIMQGNLGQQVTLRRIVDHFEATPYGWGLGVIEALVAWLVATGKVSLSQDSTPVTRAAAASVITSTSKHPYVVVTPRKEYDQSQVDRLIRFCREFFYINSEAPSDPEELGAYVAHRLGETRDQLKAIMQQAATYPFVDQLAEPIRLLDEACGRDAAWYLTEFSTADELIEANEDVIRRVLEFMHGSQSQIYRDARTLLMENTANLEALDQETVKDLVALLNDPSPFRGNTMPRLKAAVQVLREQIASALQTARTEAAQTIERRRGDVQADPSFAQAPQDVRDQAMASVDAELRRLDSLDRIDLIRLRSAEFETHTLPAVLTMLNQAASTSVASPTHPDDDPHPPVTPPPAPTVVSVKTVSVTDREGAPKVLRSKEDVETYLAMLREELSTILDSGKFVSL